LHSGFPDFEDGFQNACARQAGVAILVTRNIRDYTKSDLSIMTPDSYLKLLKRSFRK
jgi:hypothetical protein